MDTQGADTWPHPVLSHTKRRNRNAFEFNHWEEDTYEASLDVPSAV